MKTEKLARFLTMALLVLSCMAASGIMLLNLVYQAEVRYDVSEKVIANMAYPRSFVLLLGVALLAGLLSWLGGKLERINPRELFCVLTSLYAVLALYLILNADGTLRSDALSIHTAAQNLLRGDYSDFQPGGYLYRHPHQQGLALLECFLAAFSPNAKWNMLINFLFVLGINHTAYRISRELFESRAVSLLTILCSFAFLPQLFFILFVYGLIPGLFCMISAFYHTLRFVRAHRTKDLVALVLFCAGAVVLKSNCSIGVLAIAIYLVLKLLGEKPCLKRVIALVCVLLCLVVPGKLVREGLELVTKSPTDQGTPMNLYLVMGTNIDNWACIAGWYDGTNHRVYNEAHFDKQAASEVGQEMLQENLQKIRSRPRDTLLFFLNKTLSQWCEPLHQSLWSGPMEDIGQRTYTRIMESLYCDGAAEDTMTVFCQFLSQVIWVGIIAYLILLGRKQEGWELFLLYFLGGLIFHTFWEGKSQYTYPYVFCLIPCAMAGFWELSQRIRKRFAKQQNG